MTWEDHGQFTCWLEIRHESDGHTYIVVALGTSKQQLLLAVRRKLETLRAQHVRAEAALARTELVRVLRAMADEVETDVLPAKASVELGPGESS